MSDDSTVCSYYRLPTCLTVCCSSANHCPGVNLVATEKPFLTKGWSRWSVRFCSGPLPAPCTHTSQPGCKSCKTEVSELRRTCNNGLHEEAEGGEHGQPAVLDLLHLQLCQGVCKQQDRVSVRHTPYACTDTRIMLTWVRGQLQRSNQPRAASTQPQSLANDSLQAVAASEPGQSLQPGRCISECGISGYRGSKPSPRGPPDTL